jgi:diketogulonate reductase-like aldo/keto reductase
MLRWTLQKGTVVIPKSSNKARITENADIFSFSISADDMRRLDALSH